MYPSVFVYGQRELFALFVFVVVRVWHDCSISCFSLELREAPHTLRNGNVHLELPVLFYFYFRCVWCGGDFSDATKVASGVAQVLILTCVVYPIALGPGVVNVIYTSTTRFSVACVVVLEIMTPTEI